VQRRWWWWWGVAFANARQESGVWAKMPKPSHRGSISGAAREMAKGDERGGLGQKPKPSRRDSISSAPCETAEGDDGEGWCGGAYEVVVVVGLCARRTRGERGGLG
jgi:hypothetical protein